MADVPTGTRRRLWIVLCGMVAGAASVGAEPSVLFPFTQETVLSDLVEPTVVRFAADGRVFVAEKAGTVRVFAGLDDPVPDILLDLSASVTSFWDRGLLGLALDPAFPLRPYIYLFYTYDAPPGGTAPTWGDSCPDLPGANVDGCVVSARLSRFEVGLDNTVVGSEEVLLSDNWCQQFPSHSIGTVTFGPDGALYLGAGDGANFRPTNGDFAGVDFGQLGGTLPGTPTPANPCGDPPVPVGGAQLPSDAEGGALRSQDLLTAGDPVSFDGAILRIDPETGDALPDNPLFGGMVEDDDRIIAFGFRNPFRFVVHPETNEIWIGDVGWRAWEEINRVASATDSVVENFGWPCYEGAEKQQEYDGVGLTLCEVLYEEPGAVEPPFFAYRHEAPPDPDRCGTGINGAVSGIAFYLGGEYPAAYEGALLFADFVKSCIWAMLAPAGGLPEPTRIATLVANAGRPVHLEIGPAGDLFYVDLVAGAVRRVFVDPAVIFGDGFESGDTSAWIR